MIYLDYSATTPPCKKAIVCFERESERRYGNPNSLHAFGMEARLEIESSTKKIKKILGNENCEIIYTSGATEANNMAIMGTAIKKQKQGKHVITTSEEHPSVTACFSRLVKMGYEVDVIEAKKDGRIDPEELESLVRPDTILVSVVNVNSEIGSVNDIERIGNILKKYSQVTFHSDMTQAIGKIRLPKYYPDLFTFSGHKIYGLKGIGCLVRNDKTVLEPILYGGASVSAYRPGTPPEPLIVSFAAALEDAYSKFLLKEKKIAKLNRILIEGLESLDGVLLNSPDDAIGQIINFSFPLLKAPVLQKRLSDRGIFVSTQSACCFEKTYSRLINLLFGDMDRAESSIRVSISHLTSDRDIRTFLDVLAMEIESCR